MYEIFFSDLPLDLYLKIHVLLQKANIWNVVLQQNILMTNVSFVEKSVKEKLKKNDIGLIKRSLDGLKRKLGE